MFNKASATVIEPAPEVRVELEPTVPLSVLALDLGEPGVGGWHAYLEYRDIAIVVDGIGRDSISSADARRLLTEKREAEARAREAAAERERRLVEADQRRRAQLWQGLPADYLPVGVLPAAAMLQANKDARPRRTSPLEHALSNSGELVYQPIQNEE